jgi:Copper type II ascorbate-dependent monooxygenase, C-terminal domain
VPSRYAYRDRVIRPIRAVVALAALVLLPGCGSSAADDRLAGLSGSQEGGSHDGVHADRADTSATASPEDPAPRDPLEPGEQFLTVGVPDGPYTPQPRNGAHDDYRCFLVDPGLSDDAFITGVQFLPGNPEIVHHAILYRVPSDQVAAGEERDAGEEGNGWTCFGGADLPTGRVGLAALDSAPWLAAWAPGGEERRFGRSFGVHIEAGSRIVLQVHYNLTRARGDDATRVRLRLAPGDADLTPLETMLLPAPVELPCAGDETGPLCDRSNALLDLAHRFGQDTWKTVGGLHLLCDGDPSAPVAAATQSCDRRITEPTTIQAAAGHMHLLGRSIRIDLNPDTARAQTLLDVPAYDFDDQGARPLAEPVTARPGDTVRVTCTHDPELRGLLPALEGEEPRYVVWGEGTTDEMCLGILVVTRP